MFKFLFQWIISYTLIMVAMCVDNICWIPDSGEFLSIKNNFYCSIFLGRVWAFPKNKAGWDYVIKYRIKTVLTHPRDILPAIFTSLILVLFWRIF